MKKVSKNRIIFNDWARGDKDDRIREKSIYTNSENLKKELEKLLK